MGRVEMVMPKMGESIMEGTILTWLKKVGDPIEQDESVLEVATDKVDTEIPSEHAGILAEIVSELNNRKLLHIVHALALFIISNPGCLFAT